ncbi:MAG: hypothetical protein K0R57_4696 [Paenibacillaceae bacterium]|jgi:rRNA maturation endonuclease Nob1|nr:hypothetical protein [Paenibacillaceae bacterium]
MSFFKKVQEGAAKAAEKAKETVEVNRLSAQIHSKKREIDKLHQTIGESIYQSYLANDFANAESAVISMCEQIAELQKEIAAVELKIKEVKNEKDCICGRIVPLETKFCSFCGHKFEAEPKDDPAQTGQESAAAENTVQCAACQSVLEPDAQFCGDCGAAVS